MFHRHTVRIATVVAALLFAGSPSLVDAQSKTPVPTNTGNGKWMVMKADLNRSLDPNYRPDKVMADFATEEQANDYADQLNGMERDWARWSYVVYERSKNEAKRVIEQPIRKPETTFVDVPPLKTKSSLAGKKGKQKVGKWTWDVEFQADGKIVIRDPDAGGSVSSTGTWSELGGRVNVTTDTYRYSGRLKDGTIEGKRYLRSDYTEEPWSITLESNTARAPINFAGTWNYDRDFQFLLTNDGEVFRFPKGGGQPYRWGVWDNSDKKITIWYVDNDGTKSVDFQGTLSGDRMTGKYRVFPNRTVDFIRIK